MNYDEQVKEIEKLTKSIVKKSQKFAKKYEGTGEIYYIDLMAVISDLKEADNRLK